jgi:hypothetical protein
VEIWVDYSGGRPGGAALKTAGIAGAVRYAGAGSAGKRLTAAEYADLTAHGVAVRLVVETSTTGADSGYAAGVRDARAGEADRVAFGLPSTTIIYATNDKPNFVQADVDYVRGFRDVLGVARTGAYGFGSFLAAVHAAGLAGSYWQAGPAPSRTGTSSFVNLWQRQGGTVQPSDGPTLPTTATIGGVVCDLNNRLINESGVIEMELTDQVKNPNTNGNLATVNDVLFYIDTYVSDLINTAMDTNIGNKALSAKLDSLVQAVQGLTTVVTALSQAGAPVQLTGSAQVTVDLAPKTS